MTKTLPVGTIVTLLPFEDQPEQRGEYLGEQDPPFQGMHTVCLLEEYRDGPQDDGLRECEADQIKELSE